MSRLTEAQYSRLPKAARMELDRLRGEVRRLEREVQTRDGDFRSRVLSLNVIDTDRDRFLNEDRPVRFILRPGPHGMEDHHRAAEYADVRLAEDARTGKRHLRVTGNRSLIIRPHVTNWITIEVDPDY